MQMQSYRGRSRQRGVTLISMLVGSTVAILVLLTGVTFYRIFMMTSLDTASASAYNANMNFLFNVVEVETLSAGFGLQAGDSPEFIGLAEDLTAADGPYHDFYWISEQLELSPALRCKGIRERHVVDSMTGGLSVELVYLEAGAASCQKGQLLADMTWEVVEPIVSFSNSELPDYLATKQWLVDFVVEDVACAPFGLNVGTNVRKRLAVRTVSIHGVTGVLSGAAAQFASHFCLPNIIV